MTQYNLDNTECPLSLACSSQGNWKVETKAVSKGGRGDRLGDDGQEEWALRPSRALIASLSPHQVNPSSLDVTRTWKIDTEVDSPFSFSHGLTGDGHHAAFMSA